MTIKNRILALGSGIALAATFTQALAAGAPEAQGSPLLRTTDLGVVKGIDQSRAGGTYSWLGIPYAEAPVGELRWKAPVTHKPWTDTRAADKYGNGCIQQGRMFSPAPSGPHYGLDIRDGLGQPVGAEDCLTLNVTRPANDQTDLPVIVFIHGGSNVVGYSADPMYDARALAQKTNSVVVTINYRLGVFGWLDLPGLKTGDPVNDSGNFGTLDQLEALRFVNQNAAVFGGDEGNVAVMGESAGAVNVWALLVSPKAKGLVDKAIPLSGGLVFATPAKARTYAEQFSTDAIGAVSDPAEAAGKLRAASAQDLIRAEVRRGAVVGDPPAVIADGTVLPADYHAEIASGRLAGVPVLAGNTAEEGKLFGSLVGAYRPNDYNRFTAQYFFDPNKPTRLTERDFLNDKFLPVDAPGKWNDAAKQLADAIFTSITADSMNSMQAAGNKNLYYYEFEWNQEPAPFDTVYGAVHAMDLPFVFRTFDKGLYTFAFSRANQPGRLKLSDMMINSIGAFVRSGNPQHTGLGDQWDQWPRSIVLDADNQNATAKPGSF
ncbi:carboxylesterase family protein [Nocardia sp. NPDC050712]|uniref:carboxylesterase/lipase family protein n=1 Tax=Nocardia sp. NPDC050712 TaxID=3155518 RepID=UPI00340380BB